MKKQESIQSGGKLEEVVFYYHEFRCPTCKKKSPEKALFCEASKSKRPPKSEGVKCPECGGGDCKLTGNMKKITSYPETGLQKDEISLKRANKQ